MSNSDLLIAQLQRRNRIIFGSMIGGIVLIGIVLGFFLLNVPTKTPPASCVSVLFCHAVSASPINC